jgi:hypothetical protein
MSARDVASVNSRRYTPAKTDVFIERAGVFLERAEAAEAALVESKATSGRGLHSSNFKLNVSTFCRMRWVVG